MFAETGGAATHLVRPEAAPAPRDSLGLHLCGVLTPQFQQCWLTLAMVFMCSAHTLFCAHMFTEHLHAHTRARAHTHTHTHTPYSPGHSPPVHSLLTQGDR